MRYPACPGAASQLSRSAIISTYLLRVLYRSCRLNLRNSEKYQSVFFSLPLPDTIIRLIYQCVPHSHQTSRPLQYLPICYQGMLQTCARGELSFCKMIPDCCCFYACLLVMLSFMSFGNTPLFDPRSPAPPGLGAPSPLALLRPVSRLLP